LNPQLRHEINVTPFVDVALVLLIIFMVVAPLLPRGKDVRLPEARSAASQTPETDMIIVSITADKQVWLDNVSRNDGALLSTLSERLRRSPGRQVLLKGDAALSVGDVRKVLLSARKAGAPGVVLAVREGRHD
jgi:biopolymer transport protein TolR